MNLEEYYNGHYEYLNHLKKMPLNLALASVSTIIDELSKINKIDALELWSTMHETARQVNNELGEVDYDV